MAFIVLATVLVHLIPGAAAQPLARQTPVPGFATLAAQRGSSREDDRSRLFFHLDASPDISLGEQYIYQEILDRLLPDAAASLPDVTPCQWGLLYLISPQFGDFAVTMQHLNSARRVACLRGVIRYLLHEDIAEADFIRARASKASFAREWSEPNPIYPKEADEATKRLAFLAIYRKNSPLHQLHSVDADAISDVSFDDFSRWLEGNRRAKRFTFFGDTRLLEALDLPVPDPMILRPVVSLQSSRVPAGLLSFDGERFKVPGLIMVYLGHDEMTPIDKKAEERFACNRSEPSDLGDGYAAIARASCTAYDDFGDIWFSLALRRSDDASLHEFCKQVQELSRDADLATVVHFSPEGSKGLYVLLPLACKAPE